jgi:hypothetical protein
VADPHDSTWQYNWQWKKGQAVTFATRSALVHELVKLSIQTTKIENSARRISWQVGECYATVHGETFLGWTAGRQPYLTYERSLCYCPLRLTSCIVT